MSRACPAGERVAVPRLLRAKRHRFFIALVILYGLVKQLPVIQDNLQAAVDSINENLASTSVEQSTLDSMKTEEHREERRQHDHLDRRHRPEERDQHEERADDDPAPAPDVAGPLGRGERALPAPDSRPRRS